MDPPIKLFGQTIAFTTSVSSQDDALDGVATSSGAWEELSSSPQVSSSHCLFPTVSSF